MSDATLAVLGGTPAFPDGLPFVRPPIPPLARVMERLAPTYERGMLTNGPLVRELEAAVAERLGVRHVLAVSACTAGLMLVVRALVPAGRLVLPSFTFSATAHAVAWNGLQPRFAECEPDTFHLDLADAEAQLDGAGGLMAHIFRRRAVRTKWRAWRPGRGSRDLDAPHGLRPNTGAAARRVRRRGSSAQPGKPVAGEGVWWRRTHDRRVRRTAATAATRVTLHAPSPSERAPVRAARGGSRRVASGRTST
jgi:hypothetical protein